MHAFETPGRVSLRVRIPTGRVVVRTTDEPRTQVEIVALGGRGKDTIDQIEVTHDERSGRHVVSVEQRNRIQWGPLQISWGGEVEVRVSCPAGSELELNGAATDFRAEGSFGDVSARTASGDVLLGEVRGGLEIKTASGDVSVETIEGESGSLATVSGDVTIGQLASDLALRTVSGDVELRTVTRPLTLSTTSGDVNVRSLEGGELKIQSVSGDCRIGIGRGTRIWMDVSSISGDTKSELAMDDDTPAETDEASDEVVPVGVKTVSGDVTIVRAVPVG